MSGPAPDKGGRTEGRKHSAGAVGGAVAARAERLAVPLGVVGAALGQGHAVVGLHGDRRAAARTAPGGGEGLAAEAGLGRRAPRVLEELAGSGLVAWSGTVTTP